MGNYVKSVVTVIESNYEKLTPVERRIADFFIHNGKWQDFSSKTIAKQLFVSEASLSRFAQKCDFKGYREFIFQYKETFVEKQADIDSQVLQVLKTYQELLNKTYNLVNEKQLTRVVGYLNDANKVLVCGKGSSGIAASEMELRFMRIGVNIDSIQDSDQMRMRAVFQNERSTVFGFSLSGETKEVLYFLKESHKRKAKTILLTSQLQDDFLNYCTEVILVPSLRHLNYGKVISPQFPILVMIDLLYGRYVEMDRNVKDKMHEDTLKALGNGPEEPGNDPEDL